MAVAAWIQKQRRRWSKPWRQAHLAAILLTVAALITGVAITWSFTHAHLIGQLMAIRVWHSALGLILAGLVAGAAASSAFPYRRNLLDWLPVAILLIVLGLSGVVLLYPSAMPVWLGAPALPVHLVASWVLVGWVLFHAARKLGWRIPFEAAAKAERRAFLVAGARTLFGAAVAAALGSWLWQSLAGGSQAAAAGNWQIYSITGTFPDVPIPAYRLTVGGLVAAPRTYTFHELVALAPIQRLEPFHCVTGWVVSGVRWQGVSLERLLADARPLPGARYLVFLSQDGTYVDSLSIQELRASRAFLATAMDGAPLPVVHGGPVRLVVPAMYGYKSVKWVKAIRLAATRPLGTWESYGYPEEAWIT